MRVMIACLGEAPTLDIEGAPLLTYTVQQCSRLGHTPVVVAMDPRAPLGGAERVIPRGDRWLAEVISTSNWAVPVVFLRGDTFYSDYALRSLFEGDGSRWVGRMGKSWLSGHGGEIFGFRWVEEDAQRLESALQASVTHAEMSSTPTDFNGTPVGSLWQVYRLIIGNGIDVHGFDQKLWFDVADFTESFVNDGVYQRWSHTRENRWFCQKPVSLGKYDRPPGVGPVA